MSDARELSDKLKQVREELRQTRGALDTLRAQHARELKALRKSLEETREEAERLRARVKKAEERVK